MRLIGTPALERYRGAGNRAVGASLAEAVLAACSAAPPPDERTEDRLPPAAVAAFQAHLREISDGTLVCRDDSIAQLGHVTGHINDDAVRDYALLTQDLRCETRIEASTVAWFCGASGCAFPALVSEGEGFRVIPLMSGHRVRVARHYREDRFEVHQARATGYPGGVIEIREYAWRDGALRSVREYHTSEPPTG